MQEIDKVFHRCSPACQGPRLATRSCRVAIVGTLPHVGLGSGAAQMPTVAAFLHKNRFVPRLQQLYLQVHGHRAEPEAAPSLSVHRRFGPSDLGGSAGLPRSAAIGSFDDVFVVK